MKRHIENEATEDHKKTQKTGFGFSLGLATKRTKFELQLKPKEEDRNYITGINQQGQLLGGKQKEEKKVFVVPLEEGWTLKRVREYKEAKKKAQMSEIEIGSEGTGPMDSGEMENNGTETEYESKIMSLPPMLRNRAPGLDEISDDKLKFLYDVKMRPDEADLDAYDRMPLDKFGEAMLRGMGWIPGGGVGKCNKSVKIVQVVKRPHRLGLGATPKPPPEKPKKEGGKIRSAEARDNPRSDKDGQAVVMKVKENRPPPSRTVHEKERREFAVHENEKEFNKVSELNGGDYPEHRKKDKREEKSRKSKSVKKRHKKDKKKI